MRSSADPHASTSGYTVYDLGTNFQANSMNTSGVLVGTETGTNNQSQPALWQKGTLTLLPAPIPPDGYSECGADYRFWVNAAGDIAGSVEFCAAQSANTVTTPYVWAPTGGTYSAAPTLAGPSVAGTDIVVYGINAAGDLLLSVYAGGENYSVQITGADGASPVTVPNGRFPVGMLGVNQFVFDDTGGVSSVAALATPGTATSLSFEALTTSDNGYVLGESADDQTAYLRAPNGTVTTPVGGMDGDRGTPGVNSSGNIVSNAPAFVSLGATSPTPLGDLFPAGTDFDTTSSELRVGGIDDDNDIFGSGPLTGGGTTSHGFLLTAQGSAPPVVNSDGDGDAIDGGKQGCDTGQTITVNGATAVECTLRAAIEAENAGSVVQTTITFALPTDGAGVITPNTALPALTANGVTIDGTWNGTTVSLIGSALTGTSALLEISGGTDIVQNLSLCKAPTGVLLDGTAGGGTVRAVTVCGSSSAGTVGKAVLVTSPSNTIGGTSSADRNVIDNATFGIRVQGAAAKNNVVEGNWLGVSPDGSTVLGFPGIEVLDASAVTVGGSASSPGAAPGNVALGGIEVIGQTATVTGAAVQGNLVGLLPDGSQPSSTTGLVWGMTVWGTVSGAEIGGPGGERNVFDNASHDQITLNGIDVANTQIENNLLGTSVDGSTPMGGDTDPYGIEVDGAQDTQVGAAGLGNVIAAQQRGAILVNKRPGAITIDNNSTPLPGTGTSLVAASMGSVIRDDILGPAADGTTLDSAHTPAFGVELNGIGDTVGPDNVIGGNAVGVSIDGTASGESVVGNRIGTNPAGTSAVANGTGVQVAAASAGVTSSLIGAAGSEPNLISGNLDDLVLNGAATVVNNEIGTTVTGLAALPAPAPSALSQGVVVGASGGVAGPLVSVGSAAGGTVIGGTSPGYGNTISGSPGDAVVTSSAAQISGNDIGVGIDGSTAVANVGAGVRAGAPATVGAMLPGGNGTATAAGGNIIANNRGGGVVVGSHISSVQVLSDQIHDNTGAGISLADSTANAGIVAPAITQAAQDGNGHTVAFLTTQPNSIVQLFAAANCPSGSGEGQGSSVLATATADATGSLTVVLPLQSVGTELDATATGGSGTSAFSTCTAVSPTATAANAEPTTTPGNTQQTNGSGFAPGETVDASAHSQPVALGSARADANGDVSFSFTVPTTLAAGTHYVLLTGQSSGRSVAVPFTVDTEPTVPTSVLARAGLRRVVLTWAMPADDDGSAVTGYRILRSTNDRRFTTLHLTTERSYIDRAAVAGRRYYYRVVALNSVGASPPSPVVTALPYSGPSVPRSLRVNSRHAALVLHWRPPARDNGAQITGYLVQWATCVIGARHCTVHARRIRARTLTLRGLTQRIYHVRVIALNRGGESPPTRQVIGVPRP